MIFSEKTGMDSEMEPELMWRDGQNVRLLFWSKYAEIIRKAGMEV